jgi:predicted ATPase
MTVGGLSKGIKACLQASGYSQNKLADKLGLHPKVLSRKIHKNGTAYLTHQEIRRIILILIEWRAISTQDEVLQLLELAEVEPTIFSANEWRTPPLGKMTGPLLPLRSPRTPTAPLPALRHNLPAPTTDLIGRTWAVNRLQELLERESVRLVTLIGSGGSGKTRLALHVAHEMVNTFAQGVWLVTLSGVHDPEMVPMHIIQVLRLKTSPGSTPLQSLIEYLRDKQILLLLDNFEQIMEATDAVAAILEAAPGLKVLITSRMVLHLYGEHELSVPPLDFPDPGLRIKKTDLVSYPAIQLFIERAQAVQPAFLLTDENAETITLICARIDGLPLALELAAARLKVLSPGLLLEQIAKARLPMLTGGARNLPQRQQTLRNTIEWSYNLLSPTHQVWFRRLGIFTGSWSLEAIEGMMQAMPLNEPATSSALDLMTYFIDTNLCTRAPSLAAQPCFTMLETLHEYVLEQLTIHGELKQLRNWHTCYYLQEVEAAEPGLRGPEQREWLIRLIENRRDIQTALEWSRQLAEAGQFIKVGPSWVQTTTGGESKEYRSLPGESSTELPAIEIFLRLTAAFRPYWEWQGYLEEGRNWLKAALQIPLPQPARDSTRGARAKALSEAARLISLQNDQVRAIALIEESIALCRELENPIGLGYALLHRGWTAHAQNDYETACDAYRAGLSNLTPETSPWLYAQLLMHLADSSGFLSNYEEMRAYSAQSLEIFERIGDKSSCADLLKDRGGLLILEGCYTEAMENLLHSLKLCYELNHRQFIATGLGWLSFAVGLRLEPDEISASLYAAQLRGLADRQMDEIGLDPWSRTTPFIQMAELHIRSHVDAQSWDEALAIGRTMTVEEAIDLITELLLVPEGTVEDLQNAR